jgi:ATPase subunit of ABC transporter with duplicated ATPase domains
LTISHDRYFLDKLCTRTVELRDGIVRDYPGGFTDFQENRSVGTELTLKTAAMKR